jgi:DNA-binding beta-propeller fold protein YncE
MSGFIEEFPITSGVLGEPVSGSPFLTGRNPFGLVIDPSGAFLYTANTADNTISEFTINADG